MVYKEIMKNILRDMENALNCIFERVGDSNVENGGGQYMSNPILETEHLRFSYNFDEGDYSLYISIVPLNDDENDTIYRFLDDNNFSVGYNYYLLDSDMWLYDYKNTENLKLLKAYLNQSFENIGEFNDFIIETFEKFAKENKDYSYADFFKGIDKILCENFVPNCTQLNDFYDFEQHNDTKIDKKIKRKKI